jgi:hypothetical protein
MHDFSLHVGFSGRPPVAMQHREMRLSFQGTILKLRNNLQCAPVFPNGTRFFA